MREGGGGGLVSESGELESWNDMELCTIGMAKLAGITVN